MRQRRWWVMGLAAAWGLLPLACTALLGDFSSSNAPGASDGGAEGGSTADGDLGTEGASSDDARARDAGPEAADSTSPASDGSVTDSGIGLNDSAASGEAGDGEATSDGGTGDGGTGDAAIAEAGPRDAAPAFVCSAPHVTVEVGSIPNARPGQVSVYQTNTSGTVGYEVVVPDSTTNITHVFLYDVSQAKATDVPVPANLGVIAVTRYTGGLAALTVTLGDGSSGFEFTVYLLADGATAWSTGTNFLQGGFSQCLSNLQAAFVVNDATTGDYDVFFSFEDCGTPVSSSFSSVHVIDGAATKANLWPPPTDAGLFIPTFAGAAVGPSVVAVLADVPRAGAGVGPDLYTTDPTLKIATDRALAPSNPADAVEGLALAPISHGNIGASLLELSPSLGSTTLYTGTIPPSEAASLAVADLPKTVFPSVSSVPFLNATYHWETFADTNDALVGVGGQYPGDAGLGFLWQDGNGSMLALNGGTTAFFPTATINGGSATFVTPPTPTLGEFFVAYLQADPEASTTTDVMAAQIACAPPP